MTRSSPTDEGTSERFGGHDRRNAQNSAGPAVTGDQPAGRRGVTLFPSRTNDKYSLIHRVPRGTSGPRRIRPRRRSAAGSREGGVDLSRPLAPESSGEPDLTPAYRPSAPRRLRRAPFALCEGRRHRGVGDRVGACTRAPTLDPTLFRPRSGRPSSVLDRRSRSKSTVGVV